VTPLTVLLIEDSELDAALVAEMMLAEADQELYARSAAGGRPLGCGRPWPDPA
jgi:hypothetical protein